MDRATRRLLFYYVVFTVGYWLWFGLVVQNHPNHIIFYSLITLGFFATRVSRKLVIAFTPFFIYLLMYDSLRILHKFELFPIHNEGLYNLELALFGVHYQGTLMTLCEYFEITQNAFLDIWSGAFYITWAPFPILFGLWLFFKNQRPLLFRFWSCFLIANVIGIIGYIVFPAAPPWYYLQYGSEIIRNAGGEAAGLARFDEIIGIPLYTTMYSKGANTFGALPSMHAAFPMILTYYARKAGNTTLVILFFLSMISIWFSAVYTSHHYLIDVVLGIVCGILGIIIMEFIVNRNFAVRFFKYIDVKIQ